jgi:hypothetical protein
MTATARAIAHPKTVGVGDGDGDGDGDGEVHADGRLEYGGGGRDGDEDGHRALAHLGGDGDEETRWRYRPARERDGERGGAVDAAPACACRWFLRMRMETEVQRVWTYVLPIALAFGPVLAVLKHGRLASASRHTATGCAHGHARARWTSMSGLCFLALLVEYGLRTQRNACAHADRLDMTRCGRPWRWG